MNRRIGIVFIILMIIAALLIWFLLSRSPDKVGAGGTAAVSITTESADMPVPSEAAASQLEAEPADLKPAKQIANRQIELEGQEKDADRNKDNLVFGRVIYRSSGRAVAGATVRMGHSASQDGYRAVSDAEGNFRLSGVSNGHYHPTAVKGNLVSYANDRDVQHIDIKDGRRGPIILELVPAEPFTVQVLAESDNRPLAGVSVFSGGSVFFSEKTDEQGLAVLNLSPGTWSLIAVADGYARAERLVSHRGAAKKPYIIRLAEGGALFGRVSDELEIPLADVRVSANTKGRWFNTRSGPDGSFRINGIPFDTIFRVNASREYYHRAEQTGFKVNIEDPEQEVNLIMTPIEEITLKVRGQVVDELDDPVANALVKAGWGSESQSDETDENGRFEFAELQVGKDIGFSFEVSAEGYGPLRKSQPVQDSKQIEVKLTLSPASWLQGRVVDERGEPVEGADLRITYDTGGSLPQSKTETDGSFALENLPKKIELNVSKPGYAPHHSSPELNLDDLEIVLKSSGDIEGRVIDTETGAPVRDFNVRVRGSVSRPNWRKQGIDHQTDDGRFSLKGLRREARHLVIEAKGYQTGVFEDIMPEVSPETLTFELRKGGFSLAGRVVDERGNGRPAVPVRLLLLDPKIDHTNHQHMLKHDPNSEKVVEQRTATTDSAGYYLFESVPAVMRADLVVYTKGLAFTQLQDAFRGNEENRQDLLMTVPEAASIQIEINPKVISSCNFNINARGSLPFHDYGKLIGEITEVNFDSLNAGTYHLKIRLHDSNNVNYLEKFELETGEHVTFRYGFDEHFAVRGHAFSRNQPAANRRLSLKAIPDGFYSSLILDDEGWFEFLKVPTGTYQLILGAGKEEQDYGRPSGADPIDIELSTGDIERVFDFSGYGHVFGSTRDNFETINLSGNIGEIYVNRAYKTKGLKIFKFLDLRPGTYRLEGSQPDGSVLLAEFTMPADRSDLDLGEVGEKMDGKLLVTIVNQTAKPGSTVLLNFYSEGSSADKPVTYRHVKTDEPVLLEGLPQGSMTIKPGQYPAVQFSPSSHAVEIGAGTPEVQFEMKGRTILYFSSKDYLLDFVSARMSRADGTVLPFSYMDRSQIGEDMEEGMYAKGGFYKNLPPGEWTLTVVTVDNDTLSRAVTLEPGETARIEF
ncbi:MAG: carboxypeptidase regulatory-like domain-containing protein [Acidobacteriota bacterium]|nr:carboxypeptidase regulatory-like domain-containing protein [Acidobacteriota bacterium]